MSQPRPLRLIDDGIAQPAVGDTTLASPPEPLAEALAEPPAEPKVFSRTISTPSGTPWDQTRAAALEARVGAPLPLGEVVYRVRRLDNWSPGKPCRFAAFYMRARDVGEGFETVVTVDGRPVRVAFLSRAEQSRRAKRSATITFSGATAGLLIGAAVTSAIGVHADLSERLASLEQIATLQTRGAQQDERQKAQTRALNAVGARGSGLSDYLNDLAWAVTAKSPGAHIDAVHWQRGFMGVEVRGDGAPFATQDRVVIKSDKQVRPGVWLWGVEPGGRAQPTKPVVTDSPGVAP